MTDTRQRRYHLDPEDSPGPESIHVAVQNDSERMDISQKSPTPLPKFQVFLVLLIQFSEPISAIVIYPFINQFVRDTGITHGDERKTGYYAGIIESVFFLAEGATVFQWGWLSDRFGRRPVLLLGPLGLSFAMLRFGYSTSFWPMVWSRCVQGMFNGNIGVSKTVLAELTDATNIGEAFALTPIMWSTGSTLAPIIGGVLSNPALRWPNVFGKICLFKNHPYFLPCLAVAVFSFLAFLIAFLGLKETHLDKQRTSDSSRSPTSPSDTHLEHNNTQNYGSTSTRSPSATSSKASLGSAADLSSQSPDLRSILKSRRMQYIFINWIFLNFAELSIAVLTPLVFSTSIQFGGLGLTPYEIGLIMGIWGVLNGLVQINVLGKIVRKYGAVSVYKATYVCYLMIFLTYPVSTYLARNNGAVGLGSCLSLVVQFFFQFFSFMAPASIFIIIAESAPKSVLGSINGLAQMVGCVVRTIAPAMATSLFSMSVQEQILGGNFVYLVMCSLVLVGIAFSRGLTDSERTGLSSR